MRLILIHWNPEEGQARLGELRGLGFEGEWLAPAGGAGLKRFDEETPDAFLIDLTRRPSHGREVGAYLRQRKATRGVPLVFVGGDAAGVRSLLPDATYTDWEHVAAGVRAAIAQPLAAPVVPNLMAGYSGVPLAKKLGIQDGAAALLLGAPEGFAARLGALKRPRSAERVLLFVRSQAELRAKFESAAARVSERGGLWIVWPKLASGVKTDLREASVRKHGLDAGWVDYKICAVDETWSGLLFARRK